MRQAAVTAKGGIGIMKLDLVQYEAQILIDALYEEKERHKNTTVYKTFLTGLMKKIKSTYKEAGYGKLKVSRSIVEKVETANAGT